MYMKQSQYIKVKTVASSWKENQDTPCNVVYFPKFINLHEKHWRVCLFVCLSQGEANEEVQLVGDSGTDQWQHKCEARLSSCFAL